MTAVGLCVGSFLNVVVYRLPLGLAISKPVWSFCPNCHNRIAWYDNIPVFSFLRLRGRCRNCWQPIAPRYAVVEILTAVTVILLFDAFFIAHVRDGFHGASDLSWRLAEDWPIFLAHIILFTSLLAMSAIDLQFYWVDIRFTHFAAICGVILHTIWTPHHSRAWTRPFDGTAVTTAAAFAAFACVWIVIQLLRRQDARDPLDPQDQPQPDPEIGRARDARTLPVLLPLVLFVALLVTVGADELNRPLMPFAARTTLVLAFLFSVILYEASHVRESDAEIVEAIESEAPDARKRTLAELAALSPGLIAGVAALLLYLRTPDTASVINEWVHWQPLRSDWRPLWGMSTAISGYVIAASIGWFIRILANLVLGKEAFATGDIHMMAAAGCVLGWQVVLIGFMLTCFLAVAAWVALLPFKKTHAIPLGPWLWIGFLTTTVFYKYLVNTQLVNNMTDAANVLIFQTSQATSSQGVS